MKRYTPLAFAFVTTALLTGTAALAQETKELKELKEPKEQKELKELKDSKLRQYDELIIRKKSDKDGKVVIEIKDGDVFVDGKPLEDFESDNLSVRRSKTGRAITVSPFRNGSGLYNFNKDQSGKLRTGSTRTFLGVVTEEAPGGARIVSVSKGSPAEKAGLKEKDVITKIGGEKVQDENDVSKLVRARKPDEEVKITVLRDGKETTINAKLGKAEEENQGFGFTFPENGMREFNFDELQNMMPKNFDWTPSPYGTNPHAPKLGIKAQDTEDGKGVKVLDVSDESAAQKAGIKEDDIITEFDGKAVNSTDELSRQANSSFKEKVKIPVKLQRGGKTVNVEVLVPKKLKTANL